MKRIALLLLLGTVALALALGCSSGSGGTDTDDPQDTAEESIGPAGGTIELDGEARLVIPAGALTATVDFSLEENDSPAAPPAGKQFVTDAYSIEPSGTAFTIPATVTLEYDEGDLGGEDESSIVMYTDDGRGWEPLTSTVNESGNEVSAEIDHLSDFVATVGAGTSADGVFAALKVHRGIMNIPGERDPFKTDFLQAWFDSTVAPCAPASPIMVDGITCNEYTLLWSAPETLYKYAPFIPVPFLVEGTTYTYDVDGGAQAPDLTVSIDFPDASPYITDPQMNGTVSLGGFTVTWDGTGSGNVTLSIVGMGGGFVGVETANNGSYTFSAGELSELSAGVHALTLNYFNSESIDVPGYDSSSYIRAQVTSAINMTMQ